MKKFTKKSIAILLIAVILSSLLPNLISNAEEPNFTMNITGSSATTASASIGDTISIDFNLSNGVASQTNLAIIIEYDSNKLEPIPDSTDEGGIWDDSLGTMAPNGINYGKIIGDLGNGKNGISLAYGVLSASKSIATSGKLATIQFRLLEGGSTTVTYNSINYAKGDVDPTTYTSSSSVTITSKVAMTGLSLSQTSATMNKGTTLSLSATKNPTDTTDTTAISWSSSNTSVATVENGKVTAVSTGNATITATCGNFSATCSIQVINPMTALNISQTSATINKGKTLQLTASKEPTDATDSSEITWSSSNKTVATVENGKVTALANGQAVITATCGEFSATCNITVENVLTGLVINKTSLTIDKDKTEELVVTKVPEDTTNTDDIVWFTSNDEIVTVEGGVVTGIGKGTATITASCGGFEVSSQVTVLVHIESIEISNGDIDLYKGQSEKLNVIFNPTDFSDSKTIIWSTDNENVISLSNGTVTAKAPGTANVKAETVNGKSATIKVTVPEVKATELVLSKNVTSIEKGEKETLTAKVLPENTTDTTDVTWSVDNDKIITVDSNGVVTAKAPGTANVIAKSGSLESKCEVTVTSTLQSIILNKNNITLEAGETSAPLVVTLNPEDATVDTSKLKWESLNENVATIDSNGAVTAVAPGTAIIRATLEGKTVDCSIKVIATLTGVKISGDDDVLLYKNKTAKLNVEYTPSNATEIPTAKWTSSDETVATVDNTGVVTGIKEGTTVITVDYGNNIKAEKTVNVREINATGVTIVADGIQINENSAGEKYTTLPKKSETILEYVLEPEDTTDDISWTSSDESVIQIVEVSNSKTRSLTKQVTLKAISVGEATITVKIGAYTDSLKVKVNEIPITSLEVTLEKDIIEEEKTTKVNVVCKPENTTDDKIFTYKSSNESVATIDANGNITAKKAGTTYITVTAENGVASSQVKLLVIEKVELPGNTTSSGTESVNVNPQPVQTVQTVVNGLTSSPHTGDMNIFGLLKMMIVSLAGIIIIRRGLKNDR
jgi:uncharacterized protein YjdB